MLLDIHNDSVLFAGHFWTDAPRDCPLVIAEIKHRNHSAEVPSSSSSLWMGVDQVVTKHSLLLLLFADLLLRLIVSAYLIS